MIDIRRTTLVPSFAALLELRQRGELARLLAEFTAERTAVAAGIGRAPEDITVELTPSALSTPMKTLTAAMRNPRLKRQLIRLHTIHPSVVPTAHHRILGHGEVGASLHGEHIWLWASDPACSATIERILVDAAILPQHPHDRDWPVKEAYVIADALWTGEIETSLTQHYRRVDVDTNGRPLP